MTIIHPLIGMVALTLLVTLQLLYFAINSTLTGKVHIKQFRIYEGEFPANFQSARQHYKNMFEIPILFYILCILLMIQPYSIPEYLWLLHHLLSKVLSSILLVMTGQVAWEILIESSKFFLKKRES